MHDVPRCHHCGKALDEWDLGENFKIHTEVGYGSKYDLSVIDLRLCCDCFDRLVDECVLSPIVKEVSPCRPFLVTAP